MRRHLDFLIFCKRERRIEWRKRWIVESRTHCVPKFARKFLRKNSSCKQPQIIFQKNLAVTIDAPDKRAGKAALRCFARLDACRCCIFLHRGADFCAGGICFGREIPYAASFSVKLASLQSRRIPLQPAPHHAGRRVDAAVALV
jgi:hypothetical protein